MDYNIPEKAERLAEYIINQIDAQPVAPSVIVLAKYETQLDYETLRPEDQPATVQGHRQLIDDVKALIQYELGHRCPIIRTPTIDAAAYFRWLAQNQLQNNSENRALFISNPHIF
ncbi:MAG: hypothetical protein RIS92_1568 [Verrucomicrobiota bacterium]